MFRSAIKVLLCLGVWSTLLATTLSSETTDLNETEPTDTAEFRQGGQQLMPSYPYPPSGAGGAQGGYPSMGNVIRNLYRPPSLGITDKVRHWVKSFMNRRQYVKPYYGGGAPVNYDFGGKPSFSTGYKAISVPLRQLQKYYKPYYATGAEGAQFAGAGGFNAAAYGAAGSNPSGGSGGLYASETAGSSHFAGADSSFGSNPFAAASFGDTSALFAANGAGGLYGASGSPSSGLYGSSGSPSSGLFQGAGSSGGFSVDGSSDPSSYFGGSSYGSGPSSGGFGSNGAGSYLSSGNAGASFGSANGGGAGYGDLYASGANPSPSLYTGSEHQSRGYQQQQQGPKYGASSSALYMSSSDDRNGDKSSKELTNSFNVDSSRPAEASYSVSFQPQGKAAYSSYDGAGFQPVAYGSESAGPAFQEKSSS